MKRIAVVCACLFLGWAGVSAQDGGTVYEGKNGAKVTFFPNQTGFDLVGVSEDGRFFYGSSSNGAAFIYELAKDSMAFLEESNIGLLQVKDWNNYASTKYTLLNGVKKIVSEYVRTLHIDLDVESVSGDLKTLFAGYYNQGVTSDGKAAYNTLRIDAESGELIDTLPWVYPSMQRPGYMNKTFGASQDGKIVVGTSSVPFALYNTSPAFWDLEAGTSYYVGIGEDMEAGTTEGELASCNNDGTVLCGRIGNGKNFRAYIIKYNKTARTLEHVAVPLWAGSASSSASAVSETGMVVGIEDSRSFLYDMNTGEKY
ncbi:MAG: hypothetical protein K2H68_01230, partial [Bacteroidales bacterium]|nr:hypothetical protein [Bacteroidales bacterium]